ncbi:MAG TPA: YqhA family protein [Acetobacteraceae bacterium]|jgi:uncharacterized protein (TIGR00645 family)|nr:YqhA family protein [Acetobacteraceae bacterium]
MPDQDLPTRITQSLGRLMFAARWIMAPIYIGLLVGLVLLAVKFVQKLVALVPGLMAMSGSDTVLALLGLVDLSLVANLMLIVVLAGWQSFVDPLLAADFDKRPDWLVLDFSAIKLKLIGSIAVIAAILMLESFVHADSLAPATMGWQLAILLGIGVLGVLLALMDRLSHGSAKE